MIQRRVEELTDLYEKALSKIHESAEIVISSTLDNDVDALSSCSALNEWLSWIGKPHILFSKAPLPHRNENPFLKFLPLKQFMYTLPKLSKPSLLIVVDYGEFKKCGFDSEELKKFDYILGFDHHDSPAPDFPPNGLQVVDPKAASTTLLVRHFFLSRAGAPISKSMATYITLGVLGDTGVLTRLRRTPEYALRTLAECIEKGILWEEILDAARPKVSTKQLRVWARAALKMKIGAFGFISVVISRDDLYLWGGIKKDAESFLGWMQIIEDARVVALLLETDYKGVWKISIRSRFPQEISAADLARKLGGGGHADMAAADWHGDPFNAESVLRREVRRISTKS